MNCYHPGVRVLGIDYGARRVGLAVSDATGLLARPLKTLDRSGLASDEALVDAVLATVADVSRDDEPLAAIVVGFPRRLDGSPNDQTPKVEAFVRRLTARTSLPIVLQDERLTSREAESRLALKEKDWRRRKQMLDAATAAVILQDYLDARRPLFVADPDLP
jgi:putative Holliday junction resolvase